MRPLVIATRDGEVLEAALVDEKGYRKSLEQGQLWTLNPETGRLLPHAPAYRLLSIADEGRWYRALVEPPRREGAGGATGGAPQAGEAAGGADSPAGGAPGSPGDRPLTRATGAAAEREAVLTRLYELVRERQRSLPAGSYTTHLFESGVDKIRKKTGEEAVELILARERGEIVAESADLLYHVLVLLRASEIEVTEILDELGARLARDMR